MGQVEQWEAVDGYEFIYEVSDHGNVRSLDRVNSRGHSIKGRILKPAGNKYLSVSLSKHSRSKSISIHTLVAIAFIGYILEGMQVDHLDGDKYNNHVSNLEIVSQEENMRRYNSSVGNTTTTADAYIGIKLTNPEGLIVTFYPKLPNDYGLKRTDLYRVMRGERNSHKGWRVFRSD